MKDLKTKITKAVKIAQQESVQIENLYTGTRDIRKNQFLFFLKPEITQNSPSIKLSEVLDFVFTKFDEYKFEINDIRLLGSDYLKRYDVIAQHYGVINQLSSNGFKNLGNEAKQKFEEIYKQPATSDKIFGSLELLDKHNELSANDLNEKWKVAKAHKLGGGTYICQMQVGGVEYFVINGFHPLQLEHFTGKGRSIVAFTITSDTNWDVARNDFIGATNPEVANKGSLRRLFLENKNELGLPEIDGSKNGVHLSAGPIEGLVELIRFNSDLTKNKKLDVSDFKFGKAMKELFSNQQIESILSNSLVNIDGKDVSVFDLTEEKNSQEAIELLKEAKF